MGQYYTPVVLGDDDKVTHFMTCYDYNSGAKLMEHSWLGSEFVAAFETLLVQEAPVRVVWAGDYADPEVDENGKPKTIKSDMYTSGVGDANLYTIASVAEAAGALAYTPDVKGLGEGVLWTDKKDDNGDRIFTIKIDPEVRAKANAWPVIIPRIDSYPFLINWDKKVYVDKRLVPAVKYYWSDEERALHPLPLLTVEGNGRGGGDFRVEGLDDRTPPSGNFDLIGSWARDHISLSGQVNDDFTEVYFDLIEMGSDQTPAQRRKNKKLRELVGGK